MTKSLQTLVNVRVVLVLLLATSNPGCLSNLVRGLPWGDTSEPRVEGRWTGRIVSVTVHDRFGGVYEAAALSIDTGPKGYATLDPKTRRSYLDHFERRFADLGQRFRADIPEKMGQGRLPLLVEGDGIPTVIRVSDLPAGEVVEVRGLMTMTSPLTPENLTPPRTVSVNRLPPALIKSDTDHLLREHVLHVRRRPQ